jgi:hypothetical protein
LILSSAEGELGLQEEVVPGHQAVLDRNLDGLSDRGLDIVTALIGGVDAAEALAQSQFGELLRLFFLPGSSIQEAGDANTVEQYSPIRHCFLPLVVPGTFRCPLKRQGLVRSFPHCSCVRSTLRRQAK